MIEWLDINRRRRSFKPHKEGNIKTKYYEYNIKGEFERLQKGPITFCFWEVHLACLPGYKTLYPKQLDSQNMYSQ